MSSALHAVLLLRSNGEVERLIRELSTSGSSEPAPARSGKAEGRWRLIWTVQVSAFASGVLLVLLFLL